MTTTTRSTAGVDALLDTLTDLRRTCALIEALCADELARDPFATLPAMIMVLLAEYPPAAVDA